MTNEGQTADRMRDINHIARGTKKLADALGVSQRFIIQNSIFPGINDGLSTNVGQDDGGMETKIEKL